MQKKPASANTSFCTNQPKNAIIVRAEIQDAVESDKNEYREYQVRPAANSYPSNKAEVARTSRHRTRHLGLPLPYNV
eukprot:6212323-Pleurochrysis_carterae.AAC.1